MKSIAFLLSVVIFSLSMMPCTDSMTCDIDSIGFVEDTHHDHSEDENDACSPFCYCGCCSVPMTLVEFDFHIEEKTEACFSYEFSFQGIDSDAYPSSVWQPPKNS